MISWNLGEGKLLDWQQLTPLLLPHGPDRPAGVYIVSLQVTRLATWLHCTAPQLSGAHNSRCAMHQECVDVEAWTALAVECLRQQVGGMGGPANGAVYTATVQKIGSKQVSVPSVKAF